MNKRKFDAAGTSVFQQVNKKFDLWLLAAVGMLLVISCLMIYSANYGSTRGVFPAYHVKQFIFGLTGILVMIGFASIDYRLLKEYAQGFYIVTLIMLVLVVMLGRTIHGSRSWFSVGIFNVQPSEFVKLSLVIILSKFMNDRLLKELPWDIKSVTSSLAMTFLPIGLILLQPDLGTATIFLPLLLGILYIGNIRFSYIFAFVVFLLLTMGIPLFLAYAGRRQVQENHFMEFVFSVLKNIPYTVFAVIFIIALFYLVYYLLYGLKFNVNIGQFIVVSLVFISGVVASYPVRFFLKDYQKQRLIAFINPDIDRLGTGYHIIQSQIAVGSGGLFGKGFMQGTQGHLGFLPVRHTDFIFSVIAEEFGFAGALVMLVLFSIIILRGIKIAFTAKDLFGNILAGSIVWLLFVEILVNIGVALGLMPVMGVALPFVSYGGSALISSMAGIGILLSIYSRRYMH